MHRPRLFHLTALALVLAVGSASCSDTAPTTTTTTTPEAAAEPDLAVARALPALHAEADPDDGGRIVDEMGREVVLRGVNVNSLVEYWAGNEHPTVFALADDDPATMAGIGWNAVRLLVSWSLIEPEPGVYDDDYLTEVDAVIDRLAARGLYSIVDLHQDAWGPTLAARPDEGCEGGLEPALGWDGAPEWATLGGDELGTRCTAAGIRETSAAVTASFDAFWTDAAGPGGVGIRDRYVSMLAHLAERWAHRAEVAGFDVMNEPNALGEDDLLGLVELYAEAVPAIRTAEGNVEGGFSHLVLVEPAIIWSGTGRGRPTSLPDDPNLVYAPHLYSGGLDERPVETDFAAALADAAALGGLPVLSGEWGGNPSRAGPDGDGYFSEHHGMQDESGVSATLWTWRESCGDPHKVGEDDPMPWGLFDVDCTTNEVTGTRDQLIADLTRAWIRAAPGRLDQVLWDPEEGAFTASGSEAESGTTLVAFLPDSLRGTELRGEGLTNVRVVDSPDGGAYLLADAEGGSWSLTVST